jgi:copper transport protein
VSRGGRFGILAAAAAVAALAVPATAWAHAVLLRTTPTASVTLNRPPQLVRLTYSEPVEPRFAVVSVTDAAGRQVTAGSPARAPNRPDELITYLGRTTRGWYLVYWRVISADGHPVRGAFTFAVGPNPGPAPEFAVPSISETAATTQLLVARWVVFLSMMSAIGLFVLRALTARPLVRVLRGTTHTALDVALWVSLAVALVTTPIYVVLATAQFALRSAFDLGALIPLLHVTSFGRSFLDLELVLVLFALAAALCMWIDKPERPQRSIAELLATTGALLAAGACLLVPGVAGHAAQTSPRGLSLLFDWGHLAAGSIWIGGLIGLLVLWRSTAELLRVAALSFVVPRFSRIAFASVMLLIGSGIGSSLQHLPTLSSLWQTSYGKTLVVKIVLLGSAMLLAAVNLSRTKPRLQAASTHPTLAAGAAVLLRRLVSGEVVFVFGALFAAGVLASLAPPSKALAELGHVTARVGPGPVSRVVEENGYRLDFTIQPNRAALPNTFGVKITRGGKPVRGAGVVARFAMLDMTMGNVAYKLPERAPGTFERSAPALVMVGHWGLTFEVTPPGESPFEVLLVDKASG